MKSYELQPIYENLLNTYLNDTLDRDHDVFRFASILNNIDDSCSIALDGNWGSGKTFFVKQVKMVLDAYNEFIISGHEEDKVKIINLIDQHFNINKTVEFQPQVSIYYDSWANDNDEDPILSLIYEILQSVRSDFSFKKGVDCLKAVYSIIEFFTGKKVNTLIDAFKSGDPLSELKASKNVHSMIEDFLNSLLVEQGNRLVIFIDELDRCKPNYAVCLLERIKHYFANDRITFVFSVNINELQHTIKQYYGNDFNSCKYLDRFFDLRISIPPANMQKYYQSIGFNNSRYTYDLVITAVMEAYHFELREIAKFVRIAKIAAYGPTHTDNFRFAFSDGQAVQFSLLCIVPIMIGLKISDTTRYIKFITGQDYTPLKEIFGSSEFGLNMCRKLLLDNEAYEENDLNKTIVTIEEKLKSVYNALFINKFEGKAYSVNIGEYTFNKSTQLTLKRTVSLLSDYTCINTY